jgi:hypothetical protein
MEIKKPPTNGKDNSRSCFVVMPFQEPFNSYYTKIIVPAVNDVKLHPLRGDSLFRPTPIIGDIWQMVQEAKALVADLTGRNSNVFYELGLAHAIGKPIVLISEGMDDVPFDLKSLRVIIYDKNDPSWGDILRKNIRKSLEEILSDPVIAVPQMFRKKVKDQVPVESEFSSRIASLEQQMTSLQAITLNKKSNREYPKENNSSICQHCGALMKRIVAEIGTERWYECTNNLCPKVGKVQNLKYG